MKGCTCFCFAPREAFARIVRRPAFVVPAILVIVLGLAFFGTRVQKVDARAFMRTQIEAWASALSLSPSG